MHKTIVDHLNEEDRRYMHLALALYAVENKIHPKKVFQTSESLFVPRRQTSKLSPKEMEMENTQVVKEENVGVVEHVFDKKLETAQTTDLLEGKAVDKITPIKNEEKVPNLNIKDNLSTMMENFVSGAVDKKPDVGGTDEVCLPAGINGKQLDKKIDMDVSDGNAVGDNSLKELLFVDDEVMGVYESLWNEAKSGTVRRALRKKRDIQFENGGNIIGINHLRYLIILI
jgi:hypothetical protein